MGRYTPEQLKEMALVVVAREREADVRCQALYIDMSFRTGLDMRGVRARIFAMAGVPLPGVNTTA